MEQNSASRHSRVDEVEQTHTHLSLTVSSIVSQTYHQSCVSCRHPWVIRFGSVLIGIFIKQAFDIIKKWRSINKDHQDWKKKNFYHTVQAVTCFTENR